MKRGIIFLVIVTFLVSLSLVEAAAVTLEYKGIDLKDNKVTFQDKKSGVTYESGFSDATSACGITFKGKGQKFQSGEVRIGGKNYEFVLSKIAGKNPRVAIDLNNDGICTNDFSLFAIKPGEEFTLLPGNILQYSAIDTIDNKLTFTDSAGNILEVVYTDTKNVCGINLNGKTFQTGELVIDGVSYTVVLDESTGNIIGIDLNSDGDCANDITYGVDLNDPFTLKDVDVCSDCGAGLLNICDQNECLGLGYCSFEPGLVGGSCNEKPIEVGECTDTDGPDYFNKGFGYDNKKYFEENPFYDQCDPTNSNILREVICREDGFVDNPAYTCPNGCLDGACIEEKPPICPDADKDLVCDANDLCQGTPLGAKVDSSGCEIKVKVPEFCGDGICGIEEDGSNCPQDCVAPVTCTETDKGIDYAKKGTASGIDENGDYYSAIDDCSGDFLKVEYYCENNLLKTVNGYQCPYGCQDGACLEAPKCKDTESGIDYFVKGTVTDSKGNKIDDSCKEDKTTIIERYCDKNKELSIEEHTCPYGCVDGVCEGPKGKFKTADVDRNGIIDITDEVIVKTFKDSGLYDWKSDINNFGGVDDIDMNIVHNLIGTTIGTLSHISDISVNREYAALGHTITVTAKVFDTDKIFGTNDNTPALPAEGTVVILSGTGVPEIEMDYNGNQNNLDKGFYRASFEMPWKDPVSINIRALKKDVVTENSLNNAVMLLFCSGDEDGEDVHGFSRVVGANNDYTGFNPPYEDSCGGIKYNTVKNEGYTNLVIEAICLTGENAAKSAQKEILCPENEGCLNGVCRPLPDSDYDGADGKKDPFDACPTEFGSRPDGCPECGKFGDQNTCDGQNGRPYCKTVAKRIDVREFRGCQNTAASCGSLNEGDCNSASPWCSVRTRTVQRQISGKGGSRTVTETVFDNCANNYNCAAYNDENSCNQPQVCSGPTRKSGRCDYGCRSLGYNEYSYYVFDYCEEKDIAEALGLPEFKAGTFDAGELIPGECKDLSTKNLPTSDCAKRSDCRIEIRDEETCAERFLFWCKRKTVELVDYCVDKKLTQTVAVSRTSDKDNDGVLDTVDRCQDTKPEAEDRTKFDSETGCKQSQVDSDRDGFCNPGLGFATQLCKYEDSCPSERGEEGSDCPHNVMCTSFSQNECNAHPDLCSIETGEGRKGGSALPPYCSSEPINCRFLLLNIAGRFSTDEKRCIAEYTTCAPVPHKASAGTGEPLPRGWFAPLDKSYIKSRIIIDRQITYNWQQTNLDRDAKELSGKVYSIVGGCTQQPDLMPKVMDACSASRGYACVTGERMDYHIYCRDKSVKAIMEKGTCEDADGDGFLTGPVEKDLCPDQFGSDRDLAGCPGEDELTSALQKLPDLTQQQREAITRTRDFSTIKSFREGLTPGSPTAPGQIRQGEPIPLPGAIRQIRQGEPIPLPG